jgi:phosphoribosyl 1,2-cyclic phosphodiesterase
MEMYFCPLFSGSSGNALFVQYGNTRLLIDAGKPGRQIEEALRLIGVSAETLSAVLITHEHSDHIHGAGILARKYHMPVYATAETWKAMEDKLGKIPPGVRHEFFAGQEFCLGELGISPFSIPHDAADPVGYRLWGGPVSIATATDLGVFSRDVFDRIRGSDLVLLESNHDPDLLRANPHYSQQLKRRILGDRGHLSNEACSQALLSLIATGTRNVILGHLSGENNNPTLARRVSVSALEREGIRPGTDIRLQIALRDEVGDVFTLNHL